MSIGVANQSLSHKGCGCRCHQPVFESQGRGNLYFSGFSLLTVLIITLLSDSAWCRLTVLIITLLSDSAWCRLLIQLSHFLGSFATHLFILSTAIEHQLTLHSISLQRSNKVALFVSSSVTYGLRLSKVVSRQQEVNTGSEHTRVLLIAGS